MGLRGPSRRGTGSTRFPSPVVDSASRPVVDYSEPRFARRRSAGGAMLLKTADDRSGDINALESLLGRRDLDARQRRAIQDEIWSIRLGVKAETDAAYQLDFDLRDNKS